MELLVEIIEPLTLTLSLSLSLSKAKGEGRGARGQESALGITGPTKVGREFQGGDMLPKQVEQLQSRGQQTP